jgi:hypothetical protein
MTATTTAGTTRTAAAAILRAVADLIETREDIPAPCSEITFYLHGEDSPATMSAIASALPCRWQASISRSGEHEWLNVCSDARPAVLINGARVMISAPAADTCVPAGAKTVTVWQPTEALTGLLSGQPVGEVAR